MYYSIEWCDRILFDTKFVYKYELLLQDIALIVMIVGVYFPTFLSISHVSSLEVVM